MSRLIVALDDPDGYRALVERLGGLVDRYKVGSVLYTARGPAVVEELRGRGKRVFLDLKFFDIPNTVREAVAAACRLGVDLLTVHLLGGGGMMRAALAARDAAGSSTRIIGVTMLTSFDGETAAEAGFDRPLPELVAHLAGKAAAWGADGVVCSPAEVAALRRRAPRPFIIVCPGIRTEASGDDQRRVGTPRQAVRDGADYLVVGRPVTGHADPAAAAASILEDMRHGEAGLDRG